MQVIPGLICAGIAYVGIVVGAVALTIALVRGAVV